MQRFVSLLALITIVAIASAQSLPAKKNDTNKSKEIIVTACDKFMEHFKGRKIPDAIQLLRQHSLLPDSVLSALQEGIVAQVENYFPVYYGNILSYEFIKEVHVKDIIVQRIYILKTEKSFLKFEFILYNNGNDWKIHNFNYKAELIGLL